MFKLLSRRGILTHIFFFTLFIIVPVLMSLRPPGESLFTLTRPFIQDIFADFMLLCFFYLNYYVLLPRFFFNRKYFLYVLYVLLSTFIVFTVSHYVVNHLIKIRPEAPMDAYSIPHGPSPPKEQSHIFFLFDEMRRHLYLFFTAAFFSFLLRTRERLAQLNEEKLQAELSSLKSQINPHFLFNTLNNIYVLSLKKDDRASEAIVHLSGLMRYVTKDANDYKIPLQTEIEYIRNYIELQKARLNNTTDVRFECSGDPGNKEITPLVLITYIENAFKHGINPDVDDCIVEITLQVTATGIKLSVFNKKVQACSKTESTGIGMSNTSDRLKHFYPGKHTLQISENEETYSVTLSIELI
jgi:sensor histidine kinase YesM